MFTTEQRSWLDDFVAKTQGGLPPADDDASGAGGDEIDLLIAQADEPAGQDGRKGDTRSLDMASAGDATAMTCRCTFHNGTGETLTVDQASLDLNNGKLTTLPDAEVEAGKGTNFAAENTKVWTPIPFLGDVGVFGIEGHVKFVMADGETSVTLNFDNPRFEKWGKTTASATLDGPKKGDYKATGIAGSGNKAVFKFNVTGPGGGGGGHEVPPKPDAPADQAASCLITIVNKSQQTLSLDGQQNEIGDFMTMPPGTVAPGETTQAFSYVSTPHGKTPGCKGKMRYRVGDGTDTWEMIWSNPVGEKNTVEGVVESTTAKYRQLKQIGQGDENVPVTFTLSGGDGGGGGGGGGVVPPKPEEEPPFTPPAAGAKQPTLRKGDKSPDGWVEYMQTCLLTHGASVKVDGDFGAATLKAVQAFQTKNKLLVDGVVGDQTWAALRDGAPEKPKTDGRAPHTYEEKGTEARFMTEKDPVYYDTAVDTLYFSIVSVGDATSLEGHKVTARVTPPGGKPRVVQVPITDGANMTDTGQGSLWTATLPALTKTLPSTPPGAPGSAYMIEAYLDQELGGATWSGNPPAGG